MQMDHIICGHNQHNKIKTFVFTDNGALQNQQCHDCVHTAIYKYLDNDLAKGMFVQPHGHLHKAADVLTIFIVSQIICFWMKTII